MPTDGAVGVKQAEEPDRLIDNVVVATAAGVVHRQRVEASFAEPPAVDVTFPETQRVADDYTGGETLADQPGANTVLTFTFSAPVQMVVIEARGATVRADPFGGTPTAGKGVVCFDGTPTYVPVTTSQVKVHAPGGATVSVYGLRR